MARDMARRAGIWRERLPWLLLLIVFVVYAKILPTFFVQDDFWFLRDTYEPFSAQLMLRGGLPDYLRPIPTFWLPLLNRSIWGLSPFGFHVSGMICLLVAVYALYRIIFRWTGSSIAASAAAMVYGLSKIHLWNVGWVAGQIDTTAGCFLTLTLLAIARYEQGEGSLRSIGLAFALALLSKESATIVVGAWAGAAIIRMVFTRFFPVEAAADTGEEGSVVLRRQRRIAMVLAAVVFAYAALWLSLVSRHGKIGLDFSRFGYVAKSSVIAILPITAPVTPISEAWSVLPLAIAAGALLLRRMRRAHEAALGFLLWFLHAAIFAVSVDMPPLLQLYYAHFNLIGLALLMGLFCAGLLERCQWGWVAMPLRVAVIGLLAAYAWTSAAVVRKGIETCDSSPLYTARYSSQAYNQLRYLIGEHGYREVVFLSPSEAMWWAMGKGAMFISMFPGVEANFDGKKGYHAPPDLKTDDARLVVRQVSEFGFEMVR